MSTPTFAQISQKITSKYVKVEETQLHYLEAGKGEAVLCLHGFPTSAYLWRNIMPKVAETHRIIALDLPGFGKSDKPPAASYSLNYYAKILTAFLDELGIEKIHLGVHDLGGPIGMLWAVRNRDHILSISLFNTLVYPKFSVPIRIIYGSKDRILPKVARTMARIQEDLPQAQSTALPNCGHFLQEDEPENIAKLLSAFLNGNN